MSTRAIPSKGLLGTKVGMTQTFDEHARVVPVTVIQAGPCTVTQIKTRERDGYEAVQLAYADAARGRTTRPPSSKIWVMPTFLPMIDLTMSSLRSQLTVDS